MRIYDYPTVRANGQTSMTVQVLDHDGTKIDERPRRVWDCAGDMDTQVATTPYCLRTVDGKPSVILPYGVMLGIDARKERGYWFPAR